MFRWMVAAVYVLLSASGLLLFKLGANGAETGLMLLDGVLQLRMSLRSLLGIVCYVLSFLLYLYLVSQFDLTWIYPMTTGIIYVLVFLGGMMILRETVSLGQMVGSALIFVGVLVMNFFK